MKEEKSFIENAMNLGFGLLSITRDKLEKASAELVKRGELTRTEAKKWARDAEKNLEKEMKFLDKTVQDGVKNFVRKFKLPSRAEFDKLSRDVTRLKKEITKLKKGIGTGKTTKRTKKASK